MSNHKLYIAAAGSGKTTLLIEKALNLTNESCLITTFTIENERSIRAKIIKLKGYIPEHITVQTWFAFLLQHGVKPYQGQLHKKRISGMSLVPGQSAKFTKETDVRQHFLNEKGQIYSDKIAKFVVRSNEKSKGSVIIRLARIFQNIFIDEVQDLAGYDLEFLKLLFKSSARTILVGDPRQGTYSTNNSAKAKSFRRSDIVYFFQEKNLGIEIDDTTLTKNWRSHAGICDLSNSLYPDFRKTESGSTDTSGHDGVFFVRQKDVADYLKKFNPVQLRYSIATKVPGGFPVMNFGSSKGLEFDRVLIFPTKPATEWLFDHGCEFAPTSRSKFYVAITRARFSTAIVYDHTEATHINGIANYNLIIENQPNPET